MAEEQKAKEHRITVNENTVVGSQYAQLVNVSVTDIDITLQFIFVNPRDPSKAEVISRVTLPRPSGEDLAKTILSTVKLHEQQKKEKKDGTN